MWMLSTADVSFTTLIGETVKIKDMKTIDTYPQTISIKIQGNTDLDEVASRSEIYGEGTEDQSYKIFEANITELTDADFDISKLKTLRIPIA